MLLKAENGSHKIKARQQCEVRRHSFKVAKIMAISPPLALIMSSVAEYTKRKITKMRKEKGAKQVVLKHFHVKEPPNEYSARVRERPHKRTFVLLDLTQSFTTDTVGCGTV